MSRFLYVTNVIEGSTAMVTYQGNAFDIVYISAVYSLVSDTPLTHVDLGILKGTHLNVIASNTFNSTISMVTINTPQTYQSDKNGIFNMILNSESLPSNANIGITADVTGVE